LGNHGAVDAAAERDGDTSQVVQNGQQPVAFGGQAFRKWHRLVHTTHRTRLSVFAQRLGNCQSDRPQGIGLQTWQGPLAGLKPSNRHNSILRFQIQIGNLEGTTIAPPRPIEVIPHLLDALGRPLMKVKPLGDRVVIKRFEAEDKTAGGILLPDSAKNKPQKGKILAVGPGKLSKDGKRIPLELKEGDTVLFTNWAGDEFKQARGENILLMRADDILAVLHD
jgi:chaperonin GroES